MLSPNSTWRSTSRAAQARHRKSSEKHSDKFLRTSSVLLSTAACGLLAAFVTASVRGGQPRRIFVDTAPLLAVILAMQRVASAAGLWHELPPSRSFSSYGGLSGLPPLNRGDLVVVSASTSGGLARKLLDLGLPEDGVATLFFLSSQHGLASPGRVLCDLSYSAGRTFGYPAVRNFPAADCELCRKGYILAELEGDQFLLERRGVKRLQIRAVSQTADARKAFERLCRSEALRVRIHAQDSHRTDVMVDVPRFLASDPDGPLDVRRLLSRFTPLPLNVVVLVGIELAAFDAWASDMGIAEMARGAQRVTGEEVGRLKPVEAGNALVLVGCLDDHAVLRGINAQLRSKVPGGCVAYLSVVTVADSGRNLAELRVFLTYGDRGRDSFTYGAAVELMLPWTGGRRSAWTLELNLLLQLRAEAPLPPLLEERVRWLEGASAESARIFLRGEVSFMEWTPDGRIRHSTLHGLRRDKPPSAICREKAVRPLDARQGSRRWQKRWRPFRSNSPSHTSPS